MKRTAGYLSKGLMALMLLSFVCAPLVYAQPEFKEAGRGQGKGKRHEFRERNHQKFLQDIGLSEEQIAKLEAHRKSHQGEMKDSWNKLKTLKKQLREELGKYQSDQAKVDGIIAEMKALHDAKINGLVKSITFVKSVLTEEQFLKFQEKMKSKMKRHGRKFRHKKDGKGWRYQDGEDEEVLSPSMPPDEEDGMPPAPSEEE